MAGISFGGVGSGLDIAGIVNQLVAAERSGGDARIARTLSQSNAQISALGNFALRPIPCSDRSPSWAKPD